MKNKRWLTAVIFLWLVCLVIVLVGCQAPTPTPIPISPSPATETPTVTPTATITETPIPGSSICVSPPGVKVINHQASYGFFVDNQVILIGPRSDVNRAVETVSIEIDNKLVAVDLTLVEDCDLSYLGTLVGKAALKYSLHSDVEKIPSDPVFTDAQRQDKNNPLVMRLYEFPNIPSEFTEEVIGKINSNATVDGKSTAFADPNYLTGLSSSDSCGNPFSGGGSPFSGGGSPYSEPGVLTPSPNTRIGDDFINQWALVSASGIQWSNSITETGVGVRVGVFDTAPFENSTSAGGQPSNSVSTSLPARPTDLSLFIRDAVTNPLDHSSTAVNISDHGLFVASLIHVIAPSSEIHLVKVLNDYGCGDLFTIDKAMNDFLNQMSATDKTLKKVVLNLSLGVHKPDQAAKNNYQKTDWSKLSNDIKSLQEVVAEAKLFGAIIVAAAGNDSAPPIGNPSLTAQQMELPASYKDVVGVAASNQNGDRSCYSNVGDIAASGGDGGPNLTPMPLPTNSSLTCVARASTWNVPSPSGSPATCTDMKDCPFGLLGLAWEKTNLAPGYIYWAGTSFAAPLVTGFVALSLQNRGPDGTICLIDKGATRRSGQFFGSGIINITKSLTDSSILIQCP